MDGTPEFQTGAGERDNAIPEFEMRPVKNNFKSEQSGKPVFEEQEFITIRVPGDRKTEWCGRVTEEHKARFPRHYAAFKQQQEAPTEGTPLAEWPAVTRSQVLELAAVHIKTVEQIAELSDDLLNKAVPMGGYALRDKAKRWLEQAAGNAPTEALAAENALLKENQEVMQRQMDEMKKALAAMQAKQAAQ
jgi:hypothetical protein